MAYRVDIDDFQGFKTRLSQENAGMNAAVDGINFVAKPNGLESIAPPNLLYTTALRSVNPRGGDYQVIEGVHLLTQIHAFSPTATPSFYS